MSSRYCAAFPCRNLALPGSRYCLEHAHLGRPEHQKVADPFYLSPAWRRFRAWYIRKHPLCELCLKEGRITQATVVDHIIELKDGGARLAEDNAQALCAACHNKKTANVRRQRKIRQTGETYNRLGSQKQS